MQKNPKSTLERLTACDVSPMGYEARIRHQARIDRLTEACKQAAPATEERELVDKQADPELSAAGIPARPL